jgi:hypothetical protein
MDPMFSIPLFRFEQANWKEKKSRILRALPKLTDSHVSLDKDSNTDYYLNNMGKSLPAYTSTVMDCLSNSMYEFCARGFPVDPVVTPMWFETSYKSNYHGAHNHGSLGYSAILFVEFDPEVHTPTRFIAPFMNFYTGSLIDHWPKNVAEGTLLIVPSVILHDVQPNQTDKARTVIAFNIAGDN